MGKDNEGEKLASTAKTIGSAGIALPWLLAASIRNLLIQINILQNNHNSDRSMSEANTREELVVRRTTLKIQ